MRKISLLLVALIISATNFLNAQVMYQDDFESYTAGNGIASQEDPWWNTWDGVLTTGEDALVTDAFAYEGTKSILVDKHGTNPVDAVIEFPDYTTGRYRIEFYIMVPAGKLGYYNIMQNFAASGVGLEWGLQVMLKDGVMTIDGNGTAAATYSYTPGEWFKVQHFIDLNEDWIDMYINDELIHAYKWSKGTSGTGTLNKLDAFDFFAWDDDGAGTPEYYMDNFLIEEVETPYPPVNFAYTIENDNDVILTWDAPTSGSPNSYSIVRDGRQIATVDSLTFTYRDTNVYPRTYEYKVLAFYGTSSGYSSSPTPLEVTIDGGNQRSYVVFEVFGGVHCGYCPRVAKALDELVDENNDIITIDYHNTAWSVDEFITPHTQSMAEYYMPIFDANPNGYGSPATIFNGELLQEGAAEVDVEKAYFENFYTEKIDVPSVYTINATAEQVGTSPFSFNVDITVEETFHYYTDETRMMVILTESNIAYNWGSSPAMSVLNGVTREMYPSASGTTLDFSSATTYNTTIPIEIDPTWAVNNCDVVVYIQNVATGNIQEATKIDLSASANIETNNTIETRVYPNPATDVLNVVSGEKINSIEVLNILGQVIDATSTNMNKVNIDVANYEAGVYFVKIYTTNGVSTKKVTIK